jgi:predicted nucleic acid-binding protein
VIVIDASAFAAFILEEEQSEEIKPYLRKGVISLDFVLLETYNAVWKHHTLSRTLSTQQALLKLEAADIIYDDVLTIEPGRLYVKEAFILAAKERISIYDAVYIEQARRHGQLITCDKDQNRVAEKTGVKSILL